MGRKKNFRKMKKEEIAEDYCFFCKDGGDLIICDYKDCLKSYHPGCVGEDDSILEKEKCWNCARHSCYNCQKLARFQCFCCPTSVCKGCISDSYFVQVRGNNGFCGNCLKLALLIEEERVVDSDGQKVDFKDRETIEGLFMGYYEIIKKKEGWTIANLRVADRSLKEGKRLKVHSDLDDGGVSCDEDDGDSEEDNPGGRRKRFKRQKVIGERKKGKRMEYIGWGSKPLIEFLNSIGEDTTHELSQYDVINIINDYIHKMKLADPVKKKTIFFDEKLYSLFGKKKKKVSRFKINELLDDHFSENIQHSEDETGCSSDDKDSSHDEDENVFVACTREKKERSNMKLPKKKVNCNVVENCFASIVASNIKLIYLRRSLVKVLVRQPATFEEKVVGCFVRVRSDPNNYLQKNYHQLVQVKGIKKSSSTGQINSEVLLQALYMPNDIPISMLSDDDFSEEECEYLCQQVKEGMFNKLTVVELRQKALSVHEVITKHWIVRELALLQKRIDQANEKGWRAELFKYLEKKKLLQTPAEQSRLLQEVPEVIADVADSEQTSGNSSGTGELVSDKSSGKILETSERLKGNPVHGPTSTAGNVAAFVQRFGKDTFTSAVSIVENERSITKDSAKSQEKTDASTEYILQAAQRQKEPSPSEILPPQGQIPAAEAKPDAVPPEVIKKIVPKGNQHSSEASKDLPKGLNVNVDSRKHKREYDAERGSLKTKTELSTGTIDLPDGDREDPRHLGKENERLEYLEYQEVWYIRGPSGTTKGPYTLALLKRWCKISVVASEFKVWRNGQSEDNAIPLTVATGPISLPDDDQEDPPHVSKENERHEELKRQEVWYISGPTGVVKGPYTLPFLKRWCDVSVVATGFKAWREGQSRDKAILLTVATAGSPANV